MNNKQPMFSRLNRKWFWLGAIIAVCVIVVVCAILLFGKGGQGDTDVSGGNSLVPENSSSQTSDVQNDAYNIKQDSAHYFLGTVDPELKADSITSVVNEMYYTNGGHLCLALTLGNGSDKAVTLESLDVKVSNGMTDEVTVDCRVKDIPQDITIPARGTNTCKVYIEPEQIKNAYDTFEAPVIIITVNGAAE